MKVLITSGGTKIPIDLVRSITNMSHGTLGSKLAVSALELNDEVIFFCAEGSKTPMSFTADFNKEDCMSEIEAARTRSLTYRNTYHEFRYKTFDDYQETLPLLISLYKPDLIILAAAVSDYAPETVVTGKIRSAGDLNIALKPLPKVISEVRKWAGEKTRIVGFKLLVDVELGYLLGEARNSLVKNDLDMVCANDLRSILNGNHEIMVVSSGSNSFETTNPANLYSFLRDKNSLKGNK